MNFREIFLAATKEAAEHMGKLKRKEYSNEEEFYDLLRKYILAKFLLDQDFPSDDINYLAESSIKRIIQLTKGNELDRSDAPTCTGSNSKVEKKILLFTKIRDELNADIMADQMILCRTVKDLAKMLYVCIQ